MAIRDHILFTEMYDDVGDFQPPAGAVYISCSGIEDRSHHAERMEKVDGVQVITVVEEHPTTIDLHGVSTEMISLSLRSAKGLAAFWKQFDGQVVYLDITGLRHHSWIPLVRSALRESTRIKVVYVEPRDYRQSVNPTEGEIFDLSEKSLGIAPIPGFASFARVNDDFYFVPLLGFEGTRVAYLLEHVQPIGDRIIPVVGVPGFRAEYPFATFLGNQTPLKQSEAWHRVRFADANCPFALYYLLEQIINQHGNAHVKIAPVGTKPHALGAVLFVLEDQSTRELIYDHPVRKAKRTTGRSRLLAYDVSGFCSR